MNFRLLPYFALSILWIVPPASGKSLHCPKAPAFMKQVQSELQQNQIEAQNRANLMRAISIQIETLEKRDIPQSFLQWGEQTLSKDEIVEDLKELRKIFNGCDPCSEKKLQSLLEENFCFYEVKETNSVSNRITGYYAPVFRASKTRTNDYSFPLYEKPKVSMMRSRKEINQGALEGKAKVLAWMNRVDRFILQLQGSGVLRFEDGEQWVAGFHGHNGYPFTGVGKALQKDKVTFSVSPWIHGFRDYFKRHPEKMDQYFHQQERFVFFKKREAILGLAGLQDHFEGIKLEGDASMAVDLKYYPLGSVFLIGYRRPANQAQNPLIENRTELRIAQDTGGPILGPQRFDLYYGEGADAEIQASHQNSQGKGYLLRKRIRNQ